MYEVKMRSNNEVDITDLGLEPERLMSELCNQDEYDYMCSDLKICFKFLEQNFNFIKQAVISVDEGCINSDLKEIVEKAKVKFKNCKEYELCVKMKK